MKEKILDKEEFKSLLKLFGGVPSERINEIFLKGVISIDNDTGKLWIKLPLEIEEIQDPDFNI